VPRSRVEREVITFFAGGIAEAHFQGHHRGLGAGCDLGSAYDLTSCACGSYQETEAYLAWAPAAS
jgi:hypothetical protein